MNNIDNRDYFRLSDKVDAQYMPISPDQVASGTTEQHFSDAAELCVFKKLYALDMENQEILRGLDSQNHLLGNFLTNISHQVDLISQKVILNDYWDANALSPNIIDISGGGSPFKDHQYLADDTEIALRLIFTEAMLGIFCYAQSRNCQKEENSNLYRTGVAFIDLNPIDRTIIAGHILRQQLHRAELEKANEASEAP
ncbi:MAG: PilZ domain-containing protein [Pseudomonadota bacterium]|nr:PilZ domain-containing protein [Pseudomonadota bacterium]